MSGIALSASDEPVSGRRIFLKTSEGSNTAQTLAQVVTGPDGRWSAFLHPNQAQSFNAFIAQPGGKEVKFDLGVSVKAAAAIRGSAGDQGTVSIMKLMSIPGLPNH